MNFNDNKNFSAGKKSLIIRIGVVFIIAIVGLVLWHILTSYSSKAVKLMSVNEIIVSSTLFISIGTIIVRVSENILSKGFNAKRKISLFVKTQGLYSIITCQIENCGRKRIIPQNIFLMVEAGIEKDGMVYFPYLLKHEEGEFDCVFASLCKQGGFSCLPEHLLDEEFKHLYRRIIKLKHLSSETIMFIDPGEEFSEDVILKLEKGIYRVTVVWTSVKEDCICGTREFIVK